MHGFDRRSMLGFSFWSAGAALVGLPGAANATVAPLGYAHGPDRWIIDDTSAAADTESGKVIGYIRNDVRIFKGVPYAEIASPQDRWRRASKTRPWAGKRSSRSPGFVCPPDMDISPTMDEMVLRDSDLELTRPGEDCLRVNVWTPGTDNKKRQVLFFCHGGGFRDGSALMSARYEGHNLARYGDVVVVNFTHRLNALGFLDLTAHGERWADSANVGMLDIVDALKWVKANIANFGGDPDKVMIFGHSGGGAKVLTLLAMPEAKGLFNRAVVQSPGPLPLSTPDEGAALSAAFLKQVDVSPNNLDALLRLPVEQIAAAAGVLSAPAQEAHRRFELMGTSVDNVWRPVVDGRSVLYHPAQPTQASDVPLLIGTALHEGFNAIGHPEYVAMKESQARELTHTFFGPVSDSIYDTYRDAFPKASPFEVSGMARAMGYIRAHCVKIAQRRAAFSAAPSYNYWIQWSARTFEGRAMTHHEIEMPLVFMNSDAVPTITGGTARARILSVKMADAWLAFARTGNPNTKAMPVWNPVMPAAISTMVFDDKCRIDHGSDLAAIETFWKNRYPKG